MALPNQSPAASGPNEGGASEDDGEGTAVLAGLLERFLAYSIDGLPFLFGAYLSLRLAINRGLVAWNAGSYRTWMLAWTGLYVAYHAVMNSGGRAPLGKRLLGLQVLTLSGEPLSFSQSLARAIGYLLGAACLQIGFAWALLDSRGRAWHDLLAGSLVIETRAKPAVLRAAIALVSLGLLLACLGLTARTYFPGLLRPAAGAPAVKAAREGLRYVAELEEEFHRRNGRYTGDVRELAGGTGVKLSDFRQNLLERIDAEGFGIRAGPNDYLIVGSARDAAKTQVVYKSSLK